ncbi:uncharacterized protein LOC114527660 isoform X2 [Dendronephthya gigantea]|uniref:uncharacterized protein LOC114527660 isoform X2 n=1 Tax=Dendronephthya gigantea TaxID=151771 RepID=UPI00106D4549|nr:uncharacterized protein LOC114527660 isoform X2 [Dendronephthya gigantea]
MQVVRYENDEVGEETKEEDGGLRDGKAPAKSKTDGDKQGGDTKAVSSYEEKQHQLLLADCQRLKKEMTKVRSTIQRPPLKPFTPYLFNSLEPYYNQYIVDHVVGELQEDQTQEEERPRTNYGQRATSLGIVEPQVSWRMDNVPGPFRSSRLQTSTTSQKKWSGATQHDASLGSTRLPPFPKPSFPKISIPEYSASKMDYSKVLKFRIEMDQKIENLNKKKVRMDYNRTMKDWERMNLNELKELPPYSRYHVSKAIKTYFGTSKGATQAVNSLSKHLEVE